MSFVVKLHGVIVGRSELEHRDEPGLRMWGRFRPGLGYELVEPIFALRAEGGDAPRYRQALAALGLELFDAGDLRIAASEIEIVAGSGAPDELELHAIVRDARFWA